jgi:glycosyltransferase involved in cell wall biosynthesis
VRVLAFGTYQRDYPRNAQVRSCLRRVGVEVVERHVSVLDGRRDAWSAGLVAAARMVRAQTRLARSGAAEADAVLVGYPGHFDLYAARRVAAGRPVVFDPLVSLFDTLVTDRGRFRAGSLPGRALARIDRRALHAADLVVADTAAQAGFYQERFDLDAARVAVCLVGAEERLFAPRDAAPDGFHALFVGKLIPLHGLETILAAARLLPEVAFRVVGSGQLSRLLEHAPSNVTHVPWLPYEELPAAVRGAGCVLGVFGASAKTQRVIPNKAFQALACAVPLITADTPAARELLTTEVDALLVPPGDPLALANAVRALRVAPALADRVGRAGRVTYERCASEAVLGTRWRRLLEGLLA